MDAEKATVALKEVNHRQNIIHDLRRYMNEFFFSIAFFHSFARIANKFI